MRKQKIAPSNIKTALNITKILLFLNLLTFSWSCSKDENILDTNDSKYLFDQSKNQISMPKKEMRAAWIATVGNYDWPTTKANPEAQKTELKSLLDRCKNLSFNAVILQIRPVADAFYPSTLEPWSVYLTGIQGMDPGYDPLKYAVEESHKRGLDFHAWLNPYRIGSTSAVLAPNHPAVLNPKWVVVYDGTRYFNPGLPEVRAHLVAVIKDIITRYDVDAIHFDDYFYPFGAKSTSNPFGFDDKAAFEKYGNGKDIHIWRADNVNTMVSEVYKAIKETKTDVLFGISPSGRRENSVDLYADPFVWLDNKWIDYLAPQIYWEFGHAIADFAKQALFWNNNARGVPMVIGIAAYKFKDSKYPAYSTVDEIGRQLNEVTRLTNLSGSIFYRMENLENSELYNFLKKEFEYKILHPVMGNVQTKAPAAPQISLASNLISWNQISDANKFAVYLLIRDEKNENLFNAKIVSITNELKFTAEPGKSYFVTSINKQRQESVGSNIISIK